MPPLTFVKRLFAAHAAMGDLPRRQSRKASCVMKSGPLRYALTAQQNVANRPRDDTPRMAGLHVTHAIGAPGRADAKTILAKATTDLRHRPVWGWRPRREG